MIEQWRTAGIPGLRIRPPDGPWPLIIDASVHPDDADAILRAYQGALGAAGSIEATWQGGLLPTDARQLEAVLRCMAFDEVLLTVRVTNAEEDLRPLSLDPLLARFRFRALVFAGRSPNEAALRSFGTEARRRLEELMDAILGAADLDAEVQHLEACWRTFGDVPSMLAATDAYLAHRFAGAAAAEAAGGAARACAMRWAKRLPPEAAVLLLGIATRQPISDLLVDARDRLEEAGLVTAGGDLAGWAAWLREGSGVWESYFGGLFPTLGQWTALEPRLADRLRARGLGRPDLIATDVVGRQAREALRYARTGGFEAADAALRQVSMDPVLLLPLPFVETPRVRIDTLLAAYAVHLAFERTREAREILERLLAPELGEAPLHGAAGLFWALVRHRSPTTADTFLETLTPRLLAEPTYLRWQLVDFLDAAPQDSAEREAMRRVYAWMLPHLATARIAPRRSAQAAVARLGLQDPPLRAWAIEQLEARRTHERAQLLRAQATGYLLVLRLAAGAPVLPELRGAAGGSPRLLEEPIVAGLRLLLPLGQRVLARALLDVWREAHPALADSPRLRRLVRQLDRG